MAYDALAVANYFLDRAELEGRSLTPLALQKLMYFAHGWYLAMFGQPLVEQRVEAWNYGPVIRDIYREFSEFGGAPITRKATKPKSTDWDKVRLNDSQFVEPKLDAPDDVKRLLDRVWEVYGKLSGIQLSNLSHADDSPWDKTMKQTNGAGRKVISDELIKESFLAQARQNAARREQAPN